MDVILPRVPCLLGELASEPSSWDPHPLIVKTWALLQQYLSVAFGAFKLAVAHWCTSLAQEPSESMAPMLYHCQVGVYNVCRAWLVDNTLLDACQPRCARPRRNGQSCHSLTASHLS